VAAPPSSDLRQTRGALCRAAPPPRPAAPYFGPGRGRPCHSAQPFAVTHKDSLYKTQSARGARRNASTTRAYKLVSDHLDTKGVVHRHLSPPPQNLIYTPGPKKHPLFILFSIESKFLYFIAKISWAPDAAFWGPSRDRRGRHGPAQGVLSHSADALVAVPRVEQGRVALRCLGHLGPAPSVPPRREPCCYSALPLAVPIWILHNYKTMGGEEMAARRPSGPAAPPPGARRS
jgi:hypothetical protein